MRKVKNYEVAAWKFNFTIISMNCPCSPSYWLTAVASAYAHHPADRRRCRSYREHKPALTANLFPLHVTEPANNSAIYYTSTFVDIVVYAMQYEAAAAVAARLLPPRGAATTIIIIITRH
jgi:hypothetical protein